MAGDRVFFALGAALAGVSVAAGAFGAHALRTAIEPDRLEVFATAARYQMTHALALLAVAWAIGRWPNAGLALGGWLLVAGSVVFSCSLYLLVLTDAGWLGAVTPVGGVLMITGWIVLAWRVGRAAAARAPSG